MRNNVHYDPAGDNGREVGHELLEKSRELLGGHLQVRSRLRVPLAQVVTVLPLDFEPVPKPKDIGVYPDTN